MKSATTWAVGCVVALWSTVRAGPVAAGAELVESSDTLTYQGCFSSSDGLAYNSSYTWQTQSYCQGQCGQASVEGLTSKLDCWCGDSVPPASSKVADSFCNDVCGGFGQSTCGSADGKYFSVYLTGTGTVVTSDSGPASAAQSSSASTSTSSSSSTPMSSSTTSASPSVVTVGGQTVVVTASSSVKPQSSGGSGPNKAGIAAGVVVGVVAISAVAGGLYFYIRHRRRQAVEEEYRRQAAVSTFINNGKHAMTDNRLDPVIANRRLSDGSIADNEDYSRRILKVTNA